VRRSQRAVRAHPSYAWSGTIRHGARRCDHPKLVADDKGVRRVGRP
jgi:hypothetical protein